MKFINVTVAQLLATVGEKKVLRTELETELQEMEDFLASNELDQLETEDVFRSRNINASAVSIDGFVFENFSMVTTMIFTHEGYVFFSDGIHAFSLRLMMENYKKAVEELLGNPSITN